MGENTVKIVRGIPKSVGPDRKVVAPVRVEISKNVNIVVFEEIDLTIWGRE